MREGPISSALVASTFLSMFGWLLVLVQGVAWTQSPSLLPAIAWGMGTVVVPLIAPLARAAVARLTARP